MGSRGTLIDGSDGTLFEDLAVIEVSHPRSISPEITFATNIELKRMDHGSRLDNRVSFRYGTGSVIDDVGSKGTLDIEHERRSTETS